MTSDLIVAVRVQSSSVAEVGNVGSLLNMHSRHMKEADLHRKCSELQKGIVGQVFPLRLLLSWLLKHTYVCASGLIVQIQSGKLLQSAAEAEHIHVPPFYILCFLWRHIFKLICFNCLITHKLKRTNWNCNHWLTNMSFWTCVIFDFLQNTKDIWRIFELFLFIQWRS